MVLPKIKTYKPGSYLLSDGSWQTGQLYFEVGRHLEVRQPDSKQRTEYLPGDVTRFVIEADTFGVARDVSINNRRRASRLFARQLYRTPYHTIYYYQAPENGSEFGFTGSFTIVQSAEGPAIRVPQGRGPFTEAMLPFFGACPELAEGIKRGKLGPQHVQRMAATYAKWQRSSATPAN